MLPISGQSLRYLAIDEILHELPQAVTRIIDEYDPSLFEEAIHLVTTYDVRRLSKLALSKPFCPSVSVSSQQMLDLTQRRALWEKTLDQSDRNALKIIARAWNSPNCPPYIIVNLVKRFLPNKDDFPLIGSEHKAWLGHLKRLMNSRLILNEGEFFDCTFEGAFGLFYKATVTETSFISCIFTDSSLELANFSRSHFINFTFDNCHLGANFTGSNFTDGTFKDTAKFTKVAGSRFTRVSFKGCCISGDFSNCSFTNVTFRCCNINANFTGANFFDVTFDFCRMYNPIFNESTLTKTRFISATSDGSLDFNGAVFNSIQVSGTFFWYRISSPDRQLARAIIGDFVKSFFIRRSNPVEFNYTSVASRPNGDKSCVVM